MLSYIVGPPKTKCIPQYHLGEFVAFFVTKVDSAPKYDSIQATGPFSVSRDSKIHKLRNITFGIAQMCFLGVLYVSLTK